MTKIVEQKTSKKKKSVRGYFYDLSESPFHVIGVNHEKFIFPSAKKREMFLKEYDKRISSLDLLLSRVENASGRTIKIDNEMLSFITHDIYNEMKRKF